MGVSGLENHATVKRKGSIPLPSANKYLVFFLHLNNPTHENQMDDYYYRSDETVIPYEHHVVAYEWLTDHFKGFKKYKKKLAIPIPYLDHVPIDEHGLDDLSRYIIVYLN